MTQQIIDLDVISSGESKAVGDILTESIGFSHGRQSLDRSVWYNSSLMTFLATGEETQGKFALIEAVSRKGNIRLRIPIVEKMRSSTSWRATLSPRWAIAQSRERPER